MLTDQKATWKLLRRVLTGGMGKRRSVAVGQGAGMIGPHVLRMTIWLGMTPGTMLLGKMQVMVMVAVGVCLVDAGWWVGGGLWGVLDGGYRYSGVSICTQWSKH